MKKSFFDLHRCRRGGTMLGRFFQVHALARSSFDEIVGNPSLFGRRYLGRMRTEFS